MRQVSGKAFSGKFVWLFLLSGLLVAAVTAMAQQ